MTPFACSVHTHATCCDGKNTLEEMATAAYAAGVQYFGVSCHSHTPIDLDGGYVLPADMTEYRQTVLKLREEYAGRMEVLLGLEWDSQSDVMWSGFDYWIGSAHYQRQNGKAYAADWGEEAFTTLLEINTGGMARGYRDAPYPALFLLKEWRVMGGKIILTSDSHSADTILYGYGESIALAKAAGFEKSTLLTADGWMECSL